jgi:hypothetical protein
MPEKFLKGAQSDSDGILPINAKQIQSLFSVLRKVPDPRSSNQTYRIGSVLSIVAMAVFSGHKNISAIVRFAERMKMQRKSTDNKNIVASLAMLRNCYLHFYEQQEKYKLLPALTEAVAADTKLSYAMLTENL